MNTTSDVCASVYDGLKGDRSYTINLLRSLIQQHNPETKDVLELACRTGSVLAGLSSSYRVTGLDNSPAMLDHARRKLPERVFYLADMHDFHLGQKFDAIYCIHNSVNHLESFTDWIALFDCAHTQLKRGGIFILDVNTIERMELLVQSGIGVWPVSDNYVLTKVSRHPERNGHYNWEARIFQQKDPYSFTYNPTVVEVSAYPFSDILYELRKRFQLLNYFELRETERPDDYGRMYIVCRKA